MSPFNLQAVLMYSAPEYPTVVSANGQTIKLTALRQASGDYALSSQSLYNPDEVADLDRRLAAHGIDPIRKFLLQSPYPSKLAEDRDSRLTTHGIDPLRDSRRISRAEASKILMALGAQVDSSKLQEGTGYDTFLQAQLETLASPALPSEPMQARADFIQMVTLLLLDLQEHILPSFAVRELINPVESLALSKRREGVFVWPDWADSRYVNLVFNVPAHQKNAMRERIHDWAEHCRFRLNLGTSF